MGVIQSYMFKPDTESQVEEEEPLVNVCVCDYDMTPAANVRTGGLMTGTNRLPLDL